jgi:lipoprotein Spr
LSDEVTAEDNAIKDFSAARNEPRPAVGRNEENTLLSRENLMQEIINMLGAYYRFGGTNALGGIDCSAFVGTIYSRAVGMRLPRTSNAQFALGKKIRKDKLLVGDLVFFKTRRRRHAPVSHVGIYVGETLFAHASRKQGVMISSLDSRYYTKTYVGARRLINDELSQVFAR